MGKSPSFSFPLFKSPAQTLQQWAVELRSKFNNLSNRQWTPFTIVFDNTGTMTTALASVITSEYSETEDGFYDMRLHIRATTSGVATNAIGVIPPFSAEPLTEIIGTVNDGTYQVAALYANLENYWTIVKIPLSNFTLATHTIRFTGRFKKLGRE